MKKKLKAKKGHSPATATRRKANVKTPTPRASAFRLKRILVTTDFSEESRKAFPYATRLAQTFGGEIALLNVVESRSHLAGLESLVLLQSGDAEMGRVYGGLDEMSRKSFSAVAQVSTHARTGKPFREICKTARELDADLLVMATHGYSGLKHTLLGSTAERTIQHAPCPVLAVRSATTKGHSPAPKPSIEFKRILLATDFSTNSLKAFPLAQSLAEGFGAKLTLIHVVERFPLDAMLGEELTRETAADLTRQAETRLKALGAGLRKRAGFEPQIVVRFGKPFDEIVQHAKKIDASLIVVATHGYTSLKHLYLGSVAERVIRHAHCPVLVVRRPT